jgi:hypothetical protein
MSSATTRGDLPRLRELISEILPQNPLPICTRPRVLIKGKRTR